MCKAPNLPWVAASGEAAPEESRKIIADFAKDHEGSRYIAFHTDRFAAGYADTLEKETAETLLELRVFTEKAELHLIRTSLSSPFQYRVADDETLRRNIAAIESSDSFLKNPDHYRTLSRQVLDINRKFPPFMKKEKDENGCRKLCTTGGGHYALPIEEGDDTAVVITYLTYDEKNGVCSAADYRLAGFESEKGGKEA